MPTSRNRRGNIARVLLPGTTAAASARAEALKTVYWETGAVADPITAQRHRDPEEHESAEDTESCATRRLVHRLRRKIVFADLFD